MCLSLECYEYSEAVFVSHSIQSVDGEVEEEKISKCLSDVLPIKAVGKEADQMEFPHMVRPNFLLTL